MTDEHDDDLGPVTPDDETRIRALLSDARVTDPIPVEVAARLDDALVGLAAERPVDPVERVEPVEPSPATGSEASIHPFARTRRHRVVALLGAAAAVAVMGLGIGALIDRDSDSAGDSAATDASVERGAKAADEDARKGVVPEDSMSSDLLTVDTPAWEKVVRAPRAADVRSRHLSRDLAAIQSRYLPAPGQARYGKTLIHQPQGFTCPTADWGRGVLVAATYDGDPAYVAFRRPMGSTQVVEVLQCGTAEVLRSTTLPTGG
jgi:hypothetical protein